MGPQAPQRTRRSTPFLSVRVRPPCPAQCPSLTSVWGTVVSSVAINSPSLVNLKRTSSQFTRTPGLINARPRAVPTLSSARTTWRGIWRPSMLRIEVCSSAQPLRRRVVLCPFPTKTSYASMSREPTKNAIYNAYSASSLIPRRTQRPSWLSKKSLS